ncbi:MAG: succinate dehydrogenase, cytochrome b556 subunit [Lautropia sp.]|nr:succinate dehydrogenase, cytochrome b556 subunit [Lautropia sp.]
MGVSAAPGHFGETPESRRARRAAKPRFRNVGLPDLLGGYLPAMAPPAIVSILHRVSGVLMFLIGIPFMLYLLQQSLTSEVSFEHYLAMVDSWFTKLVLLGLIWAFCHHIVAGIRFLVLDLHLWTEKPEAIKSAKGVLIISLVLTAIFGLMLLF